MWCRMMGDGWWMVGEFVLLPAKKLVLPAAARHNYSSFVDSSLLLR